MAKEYNFKQIWNIYINAIKKWVDDALVIRKQYAEKISPTDTKEYIRWHDIEKAVETGWFVVWSNINRDEHAFWVEYWFSKSPVNRHKWPPRNASTRIFNGIWAQVYQRMAKNTLEEVENIIKQSINNAN